MRSLRTLVTLREELDRGEATNLVLLRKRPVVLRVRVDVGYDTLVDGFLVNLSSDTRTRISAYVRLAGKVLRNFLVHGL